MLLCGIAWHGKLLNGIAGLAVTRPISRPRLQPCEPAAAAGIAEGQREGEGGGRGAFWQGHFLTTLKRGYSSSSSLRLFNVQCHSKQLKYESFQSIVPVETKNTKAP